MRKSKKRKSTKSKQPPGESPVSGEPHADDDLKLDDVDEAVINLMEAFPGSELMPGQAGYVFKSGR